MRFIEFQRGNDMTKRQQQYNETKQRLWETGKAMIAEQGYDQVKISDITKACGLSTGNFYHYFKSKDAFFAAIEQDPYDQLTEETRNLEGSTLPDKLAYYIRERFAYLRANGVNFTRQWIRHASAPEYRQLYENEDTKVDMDIRMILQLIQEAVDSGELVPDTPVEPLAHMIVLALFGTTFYYTVRDGKFELERWGDDLSSLLRDNVLAQYFNDK